jgi:hypothetical protein
MEVGDKHNTARPTQPIRYIAYPTASVLKDTAQEEELIW